MSDHESLVKASIAAPGVQVLALNRPAKRNALSHELIGVLLVELKKASEDDTVRVIVITGSDSFFCGEPRPFPREFMSISERRRHF